MASSAIVQTVSAQTITNAILKGRAQLQRNCLLSDWFQYYVLQQEHKQEVTRAKHWLQTTPIPE